MKRLSLVQEPPRLGQAWGGQVKKAKGARQNAPGVKRSAAPKYDAKLEGWVHITLVAPSLPEDSPRSLASSRTTTSKRSTGRQQLGREKSVGLKEASKRSKGGEEGGSSSGPPPGTDVPAVPWGVKVKRYAVLALGTLTLYRDRQLLEYAAPPLRGPA